VIVRGCHAAAGGQVPERPDPRVDSARETEIAHVLPVHVQLLWRLFGLQQVFARLTGREMPAMEFRTPMLYRHVRHPLYLGLLLGFWSVPDMSLGHLLFSLGMSGYIFIGIWFEERDLVAQFGDRYRRYRERVGMVVPGLGRARSKGAP
jgi:protein-S-isoprenylcysteine O-methyltransferase Ste14